jgi:hypothetical protein
LSIDTQYFLSRTILEVCSVFLSSTYVGSFYLKLTHLEDLSILWKEILVLSLPHSLVWLILWCPDSYISIFERLLVSFCINQILSVKLMFPRIVYGVLFLFWR